MGRMDDEMKIMLSVHLKGKEMYQSGSMEIFELACLWTILKRKESNVVCKKGEEENLGEGDDIACVVVMWECMKDNNVREEQLGFVFWEPFVKVKESNANMH